jgi:hypothetical protein
LDSLAGTLSEKHATRKLSLAISIVAAAAALAISAPAASAAVLQCGDTITENTVVDNDITCADPAAIGLVIAADNVTVQFQRHTLTGAGATGAGSVGITDDGVEHTGVTIRGGTVTGFDYGVSLAASQSAILGMAFGASDTGAYVLGDDNYIFANRTDSAGTVGLDIEGDGASLWGNRIRGGPDDGIAVIGDDPLVVRNNVNGCTFDGISVSGYSLFAKLAQNTVTGCDTGIVLSGSSTVPAHLQSSEVFGNCDGLFVSDPTALVWRNKAHDNCRDGIAIAEAGATVLQNTVTNNGEIGIDAVLGTIDGGGNTASGNPLGDCFVVVCGPPVP